MILKQVNSSGPFQFPADAKLTYPLAPLITASYTDSTRTTIRIRGTVFIDSNYSGDPSLTELSESDGVFSAYVDYTLVYPSQLPPSSYNCWYLEFDYVPQNGPISYVDLKLRNTDPRTSRGTVTTVQMELNSEES